MKKADATLGRVAAGFAAVCLTGVLAVLSADAAPDIPQHFDSDGEKIYNRYNQTPLSALTGIEGRRTLERYYELRQYPGSPPRIPHEVPPSFSPDSLNCLACHEQGGYDSEKDAYIPVTPHPEHENCMQCHVAQQTDKLFVETDWQSIAPPRLGRAELPGSPPPVPHSLQFREDCIACHTGNAAAAEIQVEHGVRGNCRQCHVPMPTAEPMKEFTRTN